MDSDFTFQRPDGSEVKLHEFLTGPLILVFLRHLTCISCRAHVDEIAQRADAIKKLGGNVLVVSFAPPDHVGRYVKEFPLPFLVVSDPQLAAYKMLAMKRASFFTFLKPGVLGHYFKHMLHGWKPKMPWQGEDPFQLGGDFVLDKTGRVVYAHPCKDPSDRPSAADLVNEMRKPG